MNIKVILQTSEKSNKNGLFSSESKFESNQGRVVSLLWRCDAFMPILHLVFDNLIIAREMKFHHQDYPAILI